MLHDRGFKVPHLGITFDDFKGHFGDKPLLEGSNDSISH